MPGTLYSYARDADGRLPENQPLIQTVSVKRVNLFLDVVCTSVIETGYPSMGVITGGAGIGKSAAVRHFMAQMKPLAHTGLPAGLLIIIGPRSTPRALAKSIVEQLQERPKGRNAIELADEAVEAILANDLKLILFDECNRLNAETFDMLRHIYDRTGCPMVLVGLPTLLKVIKSQEQFNSRVGKPMVFRPLTSKEVLTTVLPELQIPRWHYDPKNPDDLEMGTYLVKRVGPSWRNLRQAIQNAAQFAIRKQEERITLKMLRETTKSGGARHEQYTVEGKASPDETSGHYEAESENRHEGKAEGKAKANSNEQTEE